MSKKFKDVRLINERDLAKLTDIIKEENFGSKEELMDFLNEMVGKPINEIDYPNTIDNKSRSRDLVYDAYEQTDREGKKMVKKALELDPNNVVAYNYLADIEKDVDKALKLYKKAIEVGQKALGKSYFEENKGQFWGLIETRPYMRAMEMLAQSYYIKKDYKNAIKIYEEMLELNPNDNQGVRFFLAALYLLSRKYAHYKSLSKRYKEDVVANWAYNNALYSFMSNGNSAKTKKLLKKAYDTNPFVIDYLIGIKEMPDELPSYIGIGDENEAIAYVFDHWDLWENTVSALDWIYEFYSKQARKMTLM